MTRRSVAALPLGGIALRASLVVLSATMGGSAALTPLVGMRVVGDVVRERGDAGVRLGAPAWSADALLRDLELRLGLPTPTTHESGRVAAFTARIRALSDKHAFYARSFEVDELGTASTLLLFRDALVEAGWNGEPIADGGERLRDLAALEARSEIELGAGDADRLACVEVTLESERGPVARLYDSIELLDAPALWPGRWRRVFALLESNGATVRVVGADDDARVQPAGDPTATTTDLGALQARLLGAPPRGDLIGDGSLLRLRGDTPDGLAELVATMLAEGRRTGSRDIVIRSGDASCLDAALGRYGVPHQGAAGESSWRPAMQVLPLAMELAFEPRDPHRVLELLTLPVGPFRGLLGARLARAVTRQPGVGGKEWRAQRGAELERLRERVVRRERERGASEDDALRAARDRVHETSARLEDWLERPGLSADGARIADLVAVVERVRAWLGERVRGGQGELYGTARAQAEDLAVALRAEAREVLTREEARQLVDHFARRAERQILTLETAGRTPHVLHPSALLAPFDRVFFWGFVGGAERRPPRLPWNGAELDALRAAGVAFGDTAAALRSEANAWRRAVLFARSAVVLVTPENVAGTKTASHPLWDEICARLDLDETRAALVTHNLRDALLPDRVSSLVVAVEDLDALALPEPRGSWHVPPELLALTDVAGRASTSVTSLEKITTCPLSWVFDQRALLRSGAGSRMASGPHLNGHLGHRLVEELHAEGAFDLPEASFLERATSRFDALLATEGATLLLSGASIERLQLARQLRVAMRSLHRYLARSGYRIAGVEEPATTISTIGPLHGRLDLRLEDADGNVAVLDLKWGGSRYEKLLASGRAVQLAIYARASELSRESHRETKGAATATSSESACVTARVPRPPAGYFSLSSGKVFANDPRMKAPALAEGPSLEETWRRVETTANAVLASHARGAVFASATRHGLPLLEALSVDDATRGDHFEAPRDAGCEYCEYDALCGRRWEALA